MTFHHLIVSLVCVSCLFGSPLIGGDEDICIDFVLSDMIEIGDEHVSGPIVFGDIAYVREWNVGIHAFDIREKSIMPLGIVLEGQFRRILGNSSHLFAQANDEILIYSIEDPLQPTLVGSVRPEMSGGISYLDDERLVFITGQEGTMLIDVSDPTSPTVESIIPVNPDVGEYHNDMVVDGQYGYLAAEYEGVRLFDLSDLSNPIDLGYAVDPHFFYVAVSVNVHNGHLHVTFMDTFVISFTRIIDITDPANPIETGSYGGTVWGTRHIFFNESIGILRSGHGIHYSPVNPAGNSLIMSRGFDVNASGAWYDEPNNRVLVTSNGAGLVVDDFDLGWINFDDECPGVCWADLNGDGELNFFDVALWIPAYLNGERAADIDNDGEIRSMDVYALIDLLAAGCP